MTTTVDYTSGEVVHTAGRFRVVLCKHDAVTPYFVISVVPRTKGPIVSVEAKFATAIRACSYADKRADEARLWE